MQNLIFFWQSCILVDTCVNAESFKRYLWNSFFSNFYRFSTQQTSEETSGNALREKANHHLERDHHWGRNKGLESKKLRRATPWARSDCRASPSIPKTACGAALLLPPTSRGGQRTGSPRVPNPLVRVPYCPEALAVLESSVGSESDVGHRSRSGQ